jgi:hypothetical protein
MPLKKRKKKVGVPVGNMFGFFLLIGAALVKLSGWLTILNHLRIARLPSRQSLPRKAAETHSRCNR